MASPVRLAYSSDDEDSSVPYSAAQVYQSRRTIEDKKPTSNPAKESVMSDPERDNVDLRARLAESQTDKKFADLLGEFRTSQAQIIGKIDALTILSTEAKNAAEEAKRSSQLTRWNTVFLVLGLFAAVIALAAFGAQALTTGKELFEMGSAVKGG